MQAAQADILADVTNNLGLTTSDGDYWNKILKDDKIKSALFPVAKASSTGFLLDNWALIFSLTILLGVLGALLYILPQSRFLPGIKNNHIYHSKMHNRGWLGIATGIFLIGFYILLYFYPHHIVNWVILVDPISEALNGGAASQWFLYGFLYTIAILVMGIRMLIKYRHNRYQLFRTSSVIFFQTAFAFLIPQILSLLNQPSTDLKNIWPLDYSFFFEYRLNYLMESGGLGIFMLVWGIVLIVLGVPLFTFFFGKRWYCSWVCGCGGLAETLGDPYRQLSDKRLGAWKIERWLIHSVLVFAIVMTALVLYTYFTGASRVGFLDSYQIRGWYGFAVGSIFAGVIGTGFYPLMGNRVWCRFGCPLAAYLGIVQRWRSKFRITTNGGQCISCGNCSTYCEMGIDVRWYAQRGQDIVRASCVGCGICSAVCPRGVLRLENGPDLSQRATDLRAIHITEEEVTLIQ
ncbi:MAG: 4Fe-4S binding protein [Phaeodactylibacter sp.]|nr:4Fe-4S binding protein [Phaeodactylibacter sp.]